MEFVILAGLALAGYQIQKKENVPRRNLDGALPPPVPEAPTDSSKFLANQKSSTTAAWGEQPGIVTPNTRITDPSRLPFFRNRGTQVNATQHQRKMEQLTGTLGAGSADNTWRHKQEQVGQRFAPSMQAIDSSGRQGNSFQGDRRMPFVSAMQNGVYVAPPVIVGPGMGLSASVLAGGGYGGGYRPKTINVNAHRVQRDNRAIVNAPTSMVAKISSSDEAGLMNTKAPPRVYEMARRPLLRGSGMASVHALKAGETFTSGVTGCKAPQSSVVGEIFQQTGIVNMENSVPAPQQYEGYDYLVERNRSDAHGGSVLNLSGAASKEAPGGYVNAAGNIDMQRIWKTMREQKWGDEAFIVSGASGIPAPRAAEQVVIAATQRDQQLEGFAGNPAHYNTGLATRQLDGVQTTIREQTEGDQAALLGAAWGGAGYGVTGAKVVCSDKQMDRLAKRGEDGQLAEGYVYGPELNDSLCRAMNPNGDSAGLGYVGMKERTVEERAGILGSIVDGLPAQPCMSAKKEVDTNPYGNATDLSLAKTQLQGNYLNRGIN